MEHLRAKFPRLRCGLRATLAGTLLFAASCGQDGPLQSGSGTEGVGSDVILGAVDGSEHRDDEPGEDRFVCGQVEPGKAIELGIYFPNDAIFFKVRGGGDISEEFTSANPDWPGLFITYPDAVELAVDSTGVFQEEPADDVTFYLTEDIALAVTRDVTDDAPLLLVTEPDVYEWLGAYMLLAPLVYDGSGLVSWIRYCPDDDDYLDQLRHGVAEAEAEFAATDPVERIVRGIEQLAGALWFDDTEDGTDQEIGSPAVFAPQGRSVRVLVGLDQDSLDGRLVCFDQSNATVDGRFCADGVDSAYVYVDPNERLLARLGIDADGLELDDEVLEIEVADLLECCADGLGTGVVIGSKMVDGQARLVASDTP